MRKYKNMHRKETPIYRGKRISVYQVFQENRLGGLSQHDWVVHPGAVTILPFLDEKTVLLIENERFAVGETLLELPAGTLEEGEAAEETAQRELIEETGYAAQNLKFLFSHYSSPGFCNERIFCFVAKELYWLGQKLDETEKISVHPILFSQAIDKIQSGEIIDAKTIATLLFWSQFYR